MIEFLRAYALGVGQILLIFAGFAVIERLRPAERGQPVRASLFNVRYLVVYQLITALLVPLAVALVVDRMRAAWPGAFGLLRIDGLLDGAWKTLAFFFVYDAFYYWFHRLQHEWPFLWAQHKLHHSEEALNATTTFRHHWLEDALRVPFIVLPMSMAFDLKPASAGMIAFIVGLWPVFIHANLRLSLGPLSGVLAGPQVHRIHHSLEPRHRDRNYAAFFPLWDVLFGSYYAPARDEYPRTGLASGERVTSIAQALWMPFATWFGRPRPRARAVVPPAAAASGDANAVQPRRWVAVASIASVLVACLLVLELAARIVFPLPEIANFNRIEYAPTTITPSMRARHYLMNATLAWSSAPDRAGADMHLNLYGFRDGAWDTGPKSARRIVFIGDSFVEGFMAADTQTIPAMFSRRAQADGQTLQVYNLGVGGTDLMDYVKLIQDAVPTLAPDEIVLVFYANDFAGAPAFGPQFIRPEFEPRRRPTWLPRIAQVIRRIRDGEPVPRAWSAAPVPFLAAVPDPSNPWTANGAALAPRVDADIADAMRKGAFNPHAVDELSEYAQLFRNIVDVSAHLTFLRDFLAAKGVRLAIAYIPYPAQVSDYYVAFKHRFGGRSVASMSGPEFQVQAAHLAQASARLGIPFLDLTAAVRGREAAGEHLYFDYDHHFRPAGYAFAADQIYEWRRADRTSVAGIAAR
jgi:sterol desaturase/sphingolipid hydroxylase (fatty acid hydroxylase superfamily)/lysophospholipase L1-like esterase